MARDTGPWGWLYVTPTRRVMASADGERLSFTERSGRYSWGEFIWEEAGVVDLGGQSLDSLREFFKWLANTPISGAPQWAKAAYGQARWYRLHRGKGWEDVLPSSIRDWASARLESLSVGEYCVDNHRVARKNSPSQVRRYKKQKARGCCGSEDVQEVGPDGHVYLLGYNYGH